MLEKYLDFQAPEIKEDDLCQSSKLAGTVVS